MYSIRVVRALGADNFEIEYEGASASNRVQTRLMLERLQDSFDAQGEPARVYMARDGVPVEAAYCMPRARD